MKIKSDAHERIQEMIRQVSEAHAKREEKRDRAARFVLNNFERVLDLVMDDDDDRAEDRVHDLRIDFYQEEQSRE